MSTRGGDYGPDAALQEALLRLRSQISAPSEYPADHHYQSDVDADGVSLDSKRWLSTSRPFSLRTRSPRLITTAAACIVLAAVIGAVLAFSPAVLSTTASAPSTEHSTTNASAGFADREPQQEAAPVREARANEAAQPVTGTGTRQAADPLIMPLAILPTDQAKRWPPAPDQREDPFASKPAHVESLASDKQDRVVNAQVVPGRVRAIDPKEAALLSKRAEAMMANGDLPAARLILRRLAEANDARAAYDLARTYDPTFLAASGEIGVKPDLAKARTWYELARGLGHRDASQRLQALAQSASATVGGR
jgi:hypothetical protein